MDYHNKIYNMDCLAGMGMLPDACIDMVLTDPTIWHDRWGLGYYAPSP